MLLAHHRQNCAGNVHRAEEQGLDLVSDLHGTEFLKEAGVKVAGIVDENVNPAELGNGGCDCVLSILQAGDVELDRHEVVVMADRRADLCWIAAGSDDGVASGARCLGNVETQATAGAGD